MRAEVLGRRAAEVPRGLSLAGALGRHAHVSRFLPRAGARRRGIGRAAGCAAAARRLLRRAPGAEAEKTSLALLYPMLVTLVAVASSPACWCSSCRRSCRYFSSRAKPAAADARADRSLRFPARPGLAWSPLSAPWSPRAALRSRSAPRTQLARPVAAHAVVGHADSRRQHARFASTLAILVGGGVPLLSALNSGARVMTNMVMREALAKARSSACAKGEAWRARSARRAFPPLMVHLVASGEVSGKLEQMLQRAAISKRRRWSGAWRCS